MTLCTDSIHVGDVGTAIQVVVQECNPDTGIAQPVPVGDATLIEFRFLPPNAGLLKIRTGEVVTPPDGLDGLVQYILAAGDIHAGGVWKFQVRIALPGGVWRTTQGTFNAALPIEPIFYFDPLPAVMTFGVPNVSAS